MSRARVSVVMAAHNAAEFVEEAVRSVRLQTYASVELVVVDDGSTDSSFSILARLAAEWPALRIVRLPGCRGLSEARNAGIDAASGQWIAFLDADDLLHPRAVELMVAAAASDPYTDVVITPMHRFSATAPDGSRTLRESSPRTLPARRALELMLYQRRGFDCSACGKLFRASLFRNPGGHLRFRPGIAFEDLELLPRLMMRARSAAWLRAPLYYYRMHPASFMHSRNPKRADVLSVALGLRDLMAPVSPALHRAASDRAYSAACGLWLLLRPWPETESFSPARTRRECLRVISEEWRHTMLNPLARLKNRLAAPLFALIAAIGR